MRDVIALRSTGPLRPAPRRGVSLSFGLDEDAGELVIRFPDGSIERLGLKIDDDGTVTEIPA